jgi:hypothetical protein
MSNSTLSTLLKKIHIPELIKVLTNNLSTSELNSLLLALFKQKSNGISPAMLFKSYHNNRFVKPSVLDPVKLMKFRINLLEAAQLKGFQPLEISPLAPLGCCSALAPVDQDRVVSAVRGVEVLSDATNVLALEAGVRRKQSPADSANLCCATRHVRAQSFDNPNFSAHFDLFCMITSGRDRGNYAFEKEAFYNHLGFYFGIFKKLGIKGNICIVLKPLCRNSYEEGLFRVIKTHLTERFSAYPVEIRTEDENFTYYTGLRFNILLVIGEEEHLIVDGGMTEWTQKLLSDKKERLLTSGLGTEYFLNLTHKG